MSSEPPEPTPPLRVLYLEDDEQDRQLAAAAMAAAGLNCSFVYAKTEAEFHAAIEQERFDLILSDFSLPSYSGMAALTTAKRRHPEVPFLLISGTIGEQRAVESLKAGAIDYILKDRLERLPGAVQRALREAAAIRERKRAEFSLRESEARFRQLAENINQVFWIADLGLSQFLYISPAFEKIWGRTCQSVYDQPKSFFEAIHPEDRPRVLADLQGPEPSKAYDQQYRIVHTDGAVRWIHALGFPVRNESGQVYRLAGLAEDVTARRQLEAQLRQAQKMDAIGQLAAGVAHDFNNLLAVMRGNAELVLMGASEPDQQTLECLQEILAASERAANLTRQLLMFSRKQTIQPQALNLNEVIANLTKMLKRIIGEHINLRCHYAQTDAWVQADSGMMEQVLVNLVVNARDAMPQGGCLEVSTTAVAVDQLRAQANPDSRPGQFICLSVSDNGTGIAPEHLPRVFEPFFTTKEVGKGSGLGLATVYGIVRQHQGWVEVASRQGQGATFSIFLPALPAPAGAVASGPTPEAPLRGGSETILLVEDELAVRIMTRRVLESYGYEVLDAGSAPEALQVWTLHEARIALLLTDMVMPQGLTGRDLAARLQARKPGLKTVFMSGYSAELAGRDTEFMRRTKSCFLQKPCTARALLETVRQCLDA